MVEGPDEESTPEDTEHFLLLSETSTGDNETPRDFHPVAMDFSWDHVTK